MSEILMGWSEKAQTQGLCECGGSLAVRMFNIDVETEPFCATCGKRNESEAAEQWREHQRKRMQEALDNPQPQG